MASAHKHSLSLFVSSPWLSFLDGVNLPLPLRYLPVQLPPRNRHLKPSEALTIALILRYIKIAAAPAQSAKDLETAVRELCCSKFSASASSAAPQLLSSPYQRRCLAVPPVRTSYITTTTSTNSDSYRSAILYSYLQYDYQASPGRT